MNGQVIVVKRSYDSLPSWPVRNPRSCKRDWITKAARNAVTVQIKLLKHKEVESKKGEEDAACLVCVVNEKNYTVPSATTELQWPWASHLNFWAVGSLPHANSTTFTPITAIREVMFEELWNSCQNLRSDFGFFLLIKVNWTLVTAMKMEKTE